jgi:N-acetylmuramoyl-L-alanine amidase
VLKLKCISILAMSIITQSIFCFENSVVLDVGHSPKQAGSTAANGYPEYTYNLSMVNSIEYFLKSRHVQVLRSSVNEDKVSLVQRATRYPNANLFFISVHHDSIPTELTKYKNQLKGFSIFVSKKNPEYEKSLKCANLIGQNLKSIGESPSTYHGINIPGENKKLLTSNGVYQYDNLVVLKKSQKPAVFLIEIGVIANPEEANRLSNQKVIWKISENIAQSIQQCLNQ